MSKHARAATALPASQQRGRFRGRAWAALVLLTQSVACASMVSSRPAAETAVPSPAEAAPWPDVVRLAAPPAQVDCTNTLRDPSLTWERAVDGSLRPAQVFPRFWALKRRESASAPAPFGLIPELEATGDDVRTIVPVDGGWLAAIDRGEGAGSGLYSVQSGANHAQRLDALLAYPVRWITNTSSGVVGVAGLCHGDACTHSTTVYRIDRTSTDSSWELYPLALLPGCPGAIGTETGADAVLVAGACGSLHRIGAAGATRLATWPSHLHPYEVTRACGENGEEGAAYVSFGGVAARFTASTAEWYAPRACPKIERGPDNLCRCVASPAP